MDTYCDHCYKRKACRPVYIEELGGFEGYICVHCRKALRDMAIDVTMLPVHG